MNLKELARIRGMNLKQLAEKCGIPPSTLYAIANGGTNFENVGIGLFMKLSAALGIDSETLYSMDEEQILDSLKSVMRTRNGKDFFERQLESDLAVALAPTDEEYELLYMFRSMDAHGKEQLMVFARGCAASYPQNKADSLGA